jgi:exonuclease III
MRIATWNVRGLRQNGKLAILEKEMERLNIQVMKVSEPHWRANRHFKTSKRNSTHMASNKEESRNGVAIIVSK